MRKNLQKALYFGIMVFIVILLLSSLVGIVFADSGYDITFKKEINPDFIGSYILFRTNRGVEWSEFGTWKNSFELFFDSKSCIKLTYNPYGTFYAADGWTWLPKENFWGEICYKLQKNK